MEEDGDSDEEQEEGEEEMGADDDSALEKEVDALMDEPTEKDKKTKPQTMPKKDDQNDKDDKDNNQKTQTGDGQQQALKNAVDAQDAAKVEKYGQFANANSILFDSKTKDFLHQFHTCKV